MRVVRVSVSVNVRMVRVRVVRVSERSEGEHECVSAEG